MMIRSRRSIILSVVAFALAGSVAAQDRSAGLRFRIEYATYLGGSQYDDLREVIPLADGSLLLGGQTVSPDFPVTEGAVQPKYGGEPAGSGHLGVYGGDCFLARLSADGRKIQAATYFGGSKQERDVYGMALDSKGNVVITTTTRSPDLPTSGGAFQRKYGGGEADVVVAKLSLDLKKLLWCTYIGGSDVETPRGGLAIDDDDNVYIVGPTNSPNFPTTPGVVGPQPKGSHDAFVVKLKGDGSRLIWSTRLGGSGADGIMGVQVDRKGNVYVGGHTESDDLPVTPGAPQVKRGGKSDCFLAALSPDATRLRYMTYLGGKENEFAEHRLALLADGSVLLTGVTASSDFPVTPQAFQRQLRGPTAGFAARLSADGTKLHFSTLLGGSGGEWFLMPTIDAAGNIYVVGHTASPDFPVTPGALQRTYGGGEGDGVFAVLSPDGSKLLYATYLGGKGEDLLRSLAFGPGGEVYLVGKTTSDDFPVTPGVAQTKRRGDLDAFIVKLVPVQP